jgi:Leucine-rich repeat (LRR) protein
LIDIAIFNTLYTGGIESNFGGMTDLNYIDLSQNFFNESLPNLNLLTNLEQIYISDSFLEGGLEFMIGMPNIFECWIDKNPGFDGTIPTEIGSLSTLASFSVTENSLTGTIPSELGNLTDMQRLWMYNNFLTGTIPNELGNMDILKVLRIEGNAFTGTMPDSVCLLRQNPLIELALLGSVCGNNFDQCSCCDCCNFADCNVL